MKIENKKILVLAPHTDDAELGCGGTISKLIKNNEIYVMAFSTCENSVIDGFPKDILKKEIFESMQRLKVPIQNLYLKNYEVRSFNARRQEILEDLISIRSDLNPDIIFIPATHDVHQDHSTIAMEAIRAFKNKTILSYEMPWNNFNFNTCCFFKLTENEIKSKEYAFSAYKSQAHRPYASNGFLISLAEIRGVQIGVKYAEAFEVIRIVYD